jgi:hypothetical protein
MGQVKQAIAQLRRAEKAGWLCQAGLFLMQERLALSTTTSFALHPDDPAAAAVD